VVIEAAVLVVGDEQQRLVPARAVADGVVDVLDELLAERDVVVGVLAVAGRSPARLEEGVLGQRPGRGVGLESGEQPEAGIRGAQGVRKDFGYRNPSMWSNDRFSSMSWTM
jgi:hypothetical protein